MGKSFVFFCNAQKTKNFSILQSLHNKQRILEYSDTQIYMIEFVTWAHRLSKYKLWLNFVHACTKNKDFDNIFIFQWSYNFGRPVRDENLKSMIYFFFMQEKKMVLKECQLSLQDKRFEPTSTVLKEKFSVELTDYICWILGLNYLHAYMKNKSLLQLIEY